MLASWIWRRQESLSALGPCGTQSCHRPRRQNGRIATIQGPQQGIEHASAIERAIEHPIGRANEHAIEHNIERVIERVIEHVIEHVIERVIERERVIKRVGRYSRHYRSFIGAAATVRGN
jgi:hypothetical protein